MAARLIPHRFSNAAAIDQLIFEPDAVSASSYSPRAGSILAGRCQSRSGSASTPSEAAAPRPVRISAPGNEDRVSTQPLFRYLHSLHSCDEIGSGMIFQLDFVGPCRLMNGMKSGDDLNDQAGDTADVRLILTISRRAALQANRRIMPDDVSACRRPRSLSAPAHDFVIATPYRVSMRRHHHAYHFTF